jgi:hypothetical protein
MISDKQLEANGAYAQHSTGPKSEADKRISSTNIILLQLRPHRGHSLM